MGKPVLRDLESLTLTERLSLVHGRRSPKYDRRVAMVFCDLIAEGLSMSSAAKRLQEAGISVTATTVRRWALRDLDGFRSIFDEARELQVHSRVDEVDHAGRALYAACCAPDSKVRRERIDAFRAWSLQVQWSAARLVPNAYGEKQSFQHTSKIDFSYNIEKRLDRLLAGARPTEGPKAIPGEAVG